MPARPALFPEPAPDPPGLSRGLACWRLQPDETAKWTRLSTTTVDCMECALLQHETGGTYGPRRTAKRRRTTPRARLDLCHAHAQAWQARDTTDSDPKGAT